QGRNLPRELGADGPAGASNEDSAPVDQPCHPVSIEHRLWPTEQILERYRLDRPLGMVEIALKIRPPPPTCERYRQSIGTVEQRANLIAGQILRGDQQLLRPLAATIELLYDGFEGIDRTENRYAVNFSANAGGCVGNNADHIVHRTRIAPHL